MYVFNVVTSLLVCMNAFTLHVHFDQNLVTVVFLFSRSSSNRGGPYFTIRAARTSVLVII